MPDLLAGTTVRAMDFPEAVSDRGDSSFSATITTYGTTASSGTYEEVGVAFMAPTSGRILILTAARMTNSSTDGTLVSPETRTGSTIGSGVAWETIGDGHGVSHYGANFARIGVSHFMGSLTPGDPYNVRLLHRVSGGTGTFALRELTVVPLP
ncbi:MAG: hypothetical protein ACRDXB_06915 [Actinomycetes bacterium]